jgi:capsid protein
MNFISRIARTFGYDAIASQGKRRPPTQKNRSEDRELTQSERVKLIGTTRELHRNFALARWMLNRHLDYVSTFSFKAQNGNPVLDDQIERLMKWWAKPRNCDAAERHSLHHIMRMSEARRTLDGDILLLKLSDGHIQPIEGDRCKTIVGSDKIDPAQFVHGVQVDARGRAKAYCIGKRLNDGFVFDRLLRAEYVEHHGYFDRFDQVRGISPMAAAINALQDVYEGFDYALAKMKISQLIGLTTFGKGDELGTTTGTDADSDGVNDSEFQIDFGKGPWHFDLDNEDKSPEIVESHNPSQEFQAFSKIMIGVCLKALDIPFSFYDEAYTNYSGARQALLQYEHSAAIKRQDNRDLLDRLTAWRMRLFVEDGELILPGGMFVRDLKWDWIPRGLPWIDPLKEVNANIAALQAGLTSRQRICKERGEDFYEITDERQEEEEYLRGAGLSTDMPGAVDEPQEVVVAADNKGGMW